MSSANARLTQPGSPNDQPWRPADGLLVEKVGDEYLVLDKGRGKIHQFNSSAAIVWQGVMEGSSIDELAASIGWVDLPGMEQAVEDLLNERQ